MESNKELKDLEVFEEGFYFIFCNYYLFFFVFAIFLHFGRDFAYSLLPLSSIFGG